MKKIIALLLLLALTAGFAVSCKNDDVDALPPETDTDGGNTDSGNTDSGNTDGGSTAKDPYSPLYAPAENRTAYTVEEDHGALGEGIGVFPGRVECAF